MQFILQDFASAFEMWEQDYRTAPEKYLTQEECAALEVSDTSAGRAEYFMQLLTEFKTKGTQ